MTTGKIIALRFNRGFGFISPEDRSTESGDIFFHSSSVVTGGFDDLREGDAVEFELEQDPRDPSRSRAANVKVLSQTEAPAPVEQAEAPAPVEE